LYAIWLIPEKKDKNYLSKIVNQLSQQYNSPKFIPHITVYGLVKINLEIIQNAIFKSIKEISPFTVKTDGLGCSDSIWKSLYINLRKNSNLTLINSKLSYSLSQFSDFSFDPHISLIYKKFPVAEKQKLINSIKIKNEIKIYSIGILKFYKNVNSWEIIKSFIFNNQN